MRLSIERRNGEVFHVIYDDDDQHLVEQHRWCMTGRPGLYYAATFVEGRCLLMHRLIMGLPDGVVDHINRNTIDNRRVNLRVVTPQENQWNRGNHGYGNNPRRGVFRLPDGKYRATITRTFGTVEEAIAQREEWESIYQAVPS